MAERHASMLADLLKDQAKEVRKGQPKKKPAPRTQTTFRCCTPDCREMMTSEAAAERHTTERGHRRIEQIVTDDILAR